MRTVSLARWSPAADKAIACWMCSILTSERFDRQAKNPGLHRGKRRYMTAATPLTPMHDNTTGQSADPCPGNNAIPHTPAAMNMTRRSASASLSPDSGHTH